VIYICQQDAFSGATPAGKKVVKISAGCAKSDRNRGNTEKDCRQSHIEYESFELLIHQRSNIAFADVSLRRHGARKAEKHLIRSTESKFHYFSKKLLTIGFTLNIRHTLSF
jgi:hypothetical protein